MGVRTWGRGLLVVLCFGWPAATAAGQDLIDHYRAARVQVRAMEVERRFGARARPFPPAWIATPSDTLRDWILARRPTPDRRPEAPPPPALRVTSWRLYRKLERGAFEARFGGIPWAFLGSNRVTPLDTTRTVDLRARMEARFGPPTRTVAELEDVDHLPREAFIEFEYWFVLNDSIPFVVMDVNGPFERGLVVAGDHRFRDRLFALRQALLGPMLPDGNRAPYVDYYYQYDTGTWYRTGYDGVEFFLKRIPRPELFRGRPRLREHVP